MTIFSKLTRSRIKTIFYILTITLLSFTNGFIGCAEGKRRVTVKGKTKPNNEGGELGKGIPPSTIAAQKVCGKNEIKKVYTLKSQNFQSSENYKKLSPNGDFSNLKQVFTDVNHFDDVKNKAVTDVTTLEPGEYKLVSVTQEVSHPMKPISETLSSQFDLENGNIKADSLKTLKTPGVNEAKNLKSGLSDNARALLLPTHFSIDNNKKLSFKNEIKLKLIAKAEKSKLILNPAEINGNSELNLLQTLTSVQKLNEIMNSDEFNKEADIGFSVKSDIQLTNSCTQKDKKQFENTDDFTRLLVMKFFEDTSDTDKKRYVLGLYLEDIKGVAPLFFTISKLTFEKQDPKKN